MELWAEEIQSLIKAIGVGIQQIGGNGDNGDEGEEEFNMKKLRYHHVILMSDADVDGFHINTLLLTFFFRFMRPLIDEGHLYMAVPPLYKVGYKKTKEFVFSDKEKEERIKEFVDKYKLKNSDSIKIQRYKGLGEMNPEELYDTTMNQETRLLKKVIYEDYLEVDLMFSKLMGKEVKSRKKFIIERYDEVGLLDI